MEKELIEPHIEKGQPFIGCLRSVRKDPIRYTANLALKHGPLAAFELLDRRVYVTADAEIAEKVLISEREAFVRGANYKRLSALVGEGLITVSDGSFWQRQRRMMQPGFHKQRIAGFVETFVRLAEDLGSRWENILGEEVPLSIENSRYTLQAVGDTIMSIPMNKEESEFATRLKSALRFMNLRHYQLFRLPIDWPLPSHMQFNRDKAFICNFTIRAIENRRRSNESHDDLLDMMVHAVDEETGQQMDQGQLVDEINTMLIAGFETSSIALTWIWYELHKHPEVENKLLDELKTIQGQEIGIHTLMQLPYLRQVVDETLRLYPPAFAIPRNLGADTRIFDGHQVKPNAAFLISLYGLHRNPKYWKNPNAFDPEHFSEEQSSTRPKNAYMPFGAGQRMCIGYQFAILEIIAQLAVLLPRYRIVPRKNYVPDMIAAITINVTDGMPVTIERR